MRVRSTILAAALTVSVLAIGAGSAVADDDHDAPHHGVGYNHKGFAGTYDSVGGPLGIVWAQAAGYGHEGMGHEPGAQR
ncbi:MULTISPECIES: hypothetical protein [unclassified Streptomyces]|uniref:hypothetical protein n=1 Tax=unclassified Streptomyces TaxID=2593676 RepID=UPI002286316C|nr:hypothetical protein [Streptomyces sp. Je 1-369]WAL93031.1 hypothetical protein NOO62_00060 [Streptomyces sp. Je 1-369]WAL99949.1 hypothetical protein NOO62_39065 [Streptomyces sp. Je 1-369]